MNKAYKKLSKRRIKQTVKKYSSASTFFVEGLKKDHFGELMRNGTYVLERDELLRFISKKQSIFDSDTRRNDLSLRVINKKALTDCESERALLNL